MSLSRVLTVTVPATARSLVDLATWKDDWGIRGGDDDAFLSRAILRCSAAAENYCNRSFGVETLVETIYLERDPFPYQIPGGVRWLQLSRWPLVAVSSVTQADAGTSTVLTVFPSADATVPADYRVMAAAGQLIRLDAFGEQMNWPAVRFDIVYQAGYILPGQSASDFPGAETLPADIEDAVGRMVYSRYAERKRDPFIKAETVEGVGRTEYIVGNPNQGDGGNLSPDVEDLLNNYRVPVAG